MANWISSKLKAAESVLQQIDQQAAGSLKKNHKFADGSGLNSGAYLAKPGGSVPLKDQLKKKQTPEISDYAGKLRSDTSLSHVYNSSYGSKGGNDGDEIISIDKEKEFVVGKTKPKTPSVNAQISPDAV